MTTTTAAMAMKYALIAPLLSFENPKSIIDRSANGTANVAAEETVSAASAATARPA